MPFQKRILDGLSDGPLEHWPDRDSLGAAIHRLPDYMKMVLFELERGPLSQGEIQGLVGRFGQWRNEAWRLARGKKDLAGDLADGVGAGLMVERDGRYALTPAGAEMARCIGEVVPRFVRRVFEPVTVSVVTVVVHVVLSVAKLLFGFFSGSAGLISDGIDNAGDTLASGLVWLGVKTNHGRLTSIFIIGLMFASVVAVGFAAYSKFADPAPVEYGWLMLAIILLAGLVMLGLSAYQYIAGDRSGNFALVCQSVDARNHFLTSLVVSVGIGLGFIASSSGARWLLYADAAASVVIGLVILKSAVELLVEFIRGGVGGGQPERVSHFIPKAHDRLGRRFLRSWLERALASGGLGLEDLRESFRREFQDSMPVFYNISGMRPRFFKTIPERMEGLLADLVRRRKLDREGGLYRLR